MDTSDLIIWILIGCGLVLVLIVLSLSTINANPPNNNVITMGNCLFPLKLYDNMTVSQIENATLICYK